MNFHFHFADLTACEDTSTTSLTRSPAVAVFSEVLDSKTGRGGTYLIYGAEIIPKVYLHYQNVCQILFSEFHSFIKMQFGADATISGIDKVIEKFQENKSPEELLDQNLVLNLLRQFESNFFFRRKRLSRFYNFFKVPFRKPSFLPMLNPFLDIKDTNKLWKKVDSKWL